MYLTAAVIACSMTFISCSHKLSRGYYNGAEAMSVLSDNNLWPGVSKPFGNIDNKNMEWFHEIIISVKGSSATIIKTPFYIQNGVKTFSKTKGGFYYYKGEVSYDSENKILKYSVLWTVVIFAHM
ncbi:MAG TPA: hypothetical protein VG676_16545 [Chitinophagaceae bacterium]|jgi:hypothetical protein|nr:hypothetical protein [Chitinophagaceae bacterium]